MGEEKKVSSTTLTVFGMPTLLLGTLVEEQATLKEGKDQRKRDLMACAVGRSRRIREVHGPRSNSYERLGEKGHSKR